MGNITGMYPDRDLTPGEALALFREVNEERFGGLFTVEPLADHPTVIEFSIEGIESAPKRWRNCFFEFHVAGPRRITSKWAHPFWAQFLYVLVKHEFGARCGAVHNDEDDPSDEPWVSDPRKHTTYQNYLALYRMGDQYDYLMEGCPDKIRTVLEGR